MSTKPVTLPRWATDLTNNDAPSSGQADTGWTPTQMGVSDYDNYIKYWTYKWVEYVNDGAFQGDFSFTGAMTYTGAATVNVTADIVNMDPMGTGTTSGLHTVLLVPNAQDWIIHGLVGGVDGREILILNTNANRVKIKMDSSTTTAANRFAPMGAHAVASDIIYLNGTRSAIRLRYRASTSKWDIVWTMGCLGHKRIALPATTATSPRAGTHVHHQNKIVVNDTGFIAFPIVLPEMSILDGYRLFVNKNSAGTTTIGSSVESCAGTTETVVQVASSTDTDNTAAPGFITLEVPSGLATQFAAVSPTVQYWVQFGSNNGASADVVLHCDIFAWVPIS